LTGQLEASAQIPMPGKRIGKLPSFEDAVVTERMQRLEIATNRMRDPVKPHQEDLVKEVERLDSAQEREIVR
jgi:hypothetical protein